MLNSDYQGPVVLVDHQGHEHEVLAALRSTTNLRRFGEQVIEGITVWSGTLTGSVSLDDILTATEPVTLRLPNGRDGSVILVGVAANRRLARVDGTGPAPF